MHKLDQSRLSFKNLPEKSDMWGNAWEVTIETTSESKVFPDNHCKVVFNSDQKFKDGLNFVVVAHVRNWELGTFEVDCQIEGRQVK